MRNRRYDKNSGKGYSRHSHNDIRYTAPPASEKGGLSTVTGRQEMARVRNRYQKELDKSNTNIVHKVWGLQESIKKLHNLKNDGEQLMEGIDNHKNERDKAFTNLQNLLVNGEKYEGKMLDKTLKGMKAKGQAIIKQKLKDVDVDTIQYGSVEQYKRLYPHYGEDIFKNIEQVNKKEREIRETQQAHNKVISMYNTLLETIGMDIQKAEDNFAIYENIKKEGNSEIKSCKYYNSVFYKIAPKNIKISLNLDMLKHNTDKFIHILDKIKDELSTYKGNSLELMKYK